jgi:S-adenosylmethionine:tRNA ribosyltransferase-isomerase
MNEASPSRNDLRVEDFDFELPEELIAQQPPAERGQSRMLVVDRATGAVRDSGFMEFASLLQAGDLLVLNDSRVIAARLSGHRVNVRDREPANGTIGVLLVEPAGADSWRALVKPGKKVRVGDRLVFAAASGSTELTADVIEHGEFGERVLRFESVEDFFGVLDRIGHMPLPPYIRRDDGNADRERYQTVFSREQGSIAAPTAGLHFTRGVLDSLTAKGVEMARVTLHVGLGTFAPLRVEKVSEVHLHRERYSLSAEAADAINRARRDGRRVVAVGTTVVRTLEHCAAQADGGELKEHSGETEIFISPGYKFRIIGGLLTNFHLPKSSLLMLVSAFAGRENVLAAYRHAVEQGYRFFSYGDCMFLG